MKPALMMNSRRTVFLCVLAVGFPSCPCQGESKHSNTSLHPSYRGLVMCGYQGWFRADGDGAGRGWTHYGAGGQFDPEHITIDFWPDVSEYEKTYPTQFDHSNGDTAHLFSSWDKSTIDLHFKWMKQYKISGAFMQRFFRVTHTAESRGTGRVILGHALEAAEKQGRAIAVMYDLSGLKPRGEDCSSVIQDWKELVDQLRVTSRGDQQAYLYHNGKPLVAIWGIGFPDRPYSIRDIGFERLLDFLQHDPVYGGCSIMLGVPTNFRTLDGDTVSDPYLHKLIGRVDIVMPWMVQRFKDTSAEELLRYHNHVKDDQSWCQQRKVDYAPLVFPGFSWHNLGIHSFDGKYPLDQNPRQGGRLYWGLIHEAIRAGAEMLYVAMFDEIDEGTAIFKCTNDPPIGFPCLTYEGLPTDHYLWLTGKAAEMLRSEIPLSSELPERRAEISARDSD